MSSDVAIKCLLECDSSLFIIIPLLIIAYNNFALCTVGIALHDSFSKVSGLAHIMLPYRSQALNSENKAKFADTAIGELLSEMLKLGASKARISAKIAGGAQMFAFNSTSELMNIGKRNVQATKEILWHHRLPLIAEDTGGTYGRTIELHSQTGLLLIKTIGRGTKSI